MPSLGAGQWTIRRFLEASGQAIRVFDVNLRQAFYSPELIPESLSLANVLKLNDDELPVVAAACGVSADDRVAAVHELAERHGLLLATLTRGAARAEGGMPPPYRVCRSPIRRRNNHGFR